MTISYTDHGRIHWKSQLHMSHQRPASGRKHVDPLKHHSVLNQPSLPPIPIRDQRILVSSAASTSPIFDFQFPHFRTGGGSDA